VSIQQVKKTIIEIKLWIIAARTAPFAGLAAVFFSNFFGNDSLKELTLAAIGVVFVTVSVFWWWWAMTKISRFFGIIQDTDKRLHTIKKHIKDIKEEF
jgi:uncharacterized membrane protein